MGRGSVADVHGIYQAAADERYRPTKPSTIQKIIIINLAGLFSQLSRLEAERGRFNWLRVTLPQCRNLMRDLGMGTCFVST